MKYNNKKVEQNFYDEILSTKTRIEVKPGKCRYNYKCQMNATHEAIRKSHKELAMVVYMASGRVDPVVHFVNFDGKDYIDNTLGEWSKQHEYYLIRHIGEKDFFHVDYIFRAYCKTVRKSLSLWLKLTSDIKF